MLQAKQRIVILGGGYAGMLAAARIARAGDRADVTLVDVKPDFVQRIRLHQALVGSQPQTLAYGPLLQRRGVRFVQAAVETLEPASQRVTGRRTTGEPLTLNYDHLIVALGSRTPASVPGVREHTLRLNDRAAVAVGHAHLRDLAQRRGRVLVVGNGLTGIETATELAERWPGLRVSLVAGHALDHDYSVSGGAHLRHRLARLQIEPVEDGRVVGIEAGIAYTTRSSLPFDLCIWAGGFEAQPVARQAGLPVDDAGRMVVDEFLRSTAHPNIFAIGDMASVMRAGSSLRMGCVTALPMGAYVGATLARLLHGAEPQPFAFDYALRCISLGRNDGLVQFTASDDTPQARVWTRRPATLTKEAICRMTFTVVHMELRLGLPLYHWPQAAVQPPTPVQKATS